MFESLSERLQNIVRGKLTEDNMQDTLREIRRALLEADVNLLVVKEFIHNIREKAQGEKILSGVNPSQQLVKIVHDELVKILGKDLSPLNLTGHPTLIMMLGLQGSGKTTSSAKLAVKLKKEGKNPLLVACDVYRPAAIKQLQTLGEQIGVEVFTEDTKNVESIVKNAIAYAKQNGFNVVILDTAGRLQTDTDMMAELLIIDRVFAPHEKLLVIDSIMGQEAVNVAQDFDEQIGVTGLVLTKLDGDARGGAALSVVHSTGKPIKLTGTGEKLNALENFYPERMATRILGMGDIVSLVERAQEVFDEKQALELEKKMKKAEFSFNDFLSMQKQMKAFGSIEQILTMLPVPSLKKEDKELISHKGEQELKKIEVFIQSMTEEERNNPDIIDSSRKKRIAKGCGMSLHDVNIFIKQFEQMRQMMKGMSNMKDKMKHMPNLGSMANMAKAMKMMKKFRR
ncbi:MAG: signal recognition particle protein [Candidatus Melainabacteria bacterium]|nr:MAG: signal recognition particle protein [Candidatus Melainabacteria bacterium]